MIQQLEHLLAHEFDPGFEQRARFIFEAIEEYKPKKILDAGCGRGFYSHGVAFYPFIQKIQGFDVNDQYLALAKTHCKDKRIKLKKANIYSLPYPDNSFDFIIFSEVLEHLTSEKRALDELKRVLKKDGIIALTIPNEQFPFLWDPLNWLLMKLFHTHVPKDIWWLAGIWADHERLYSPERLERVLHKNDFEVVEQKKVIHWSWPFAHLILYGIGKNLIERLGFKMGNRFSYKKKGLAIEILAAIMKAPSTLLDSNIPLSSSVNICMLLKK